MAQFEYDLVTLGAGSGGVAGSRRAASYGARVAICELDRVGGTCVLRGCVPKKLLVYGAHFAEDLEDAAGFGWTIEPPRFDWSVLQAHKNQELERLNKVYTRLLRDSGVHIAHGAARLLDAHTVQVGEQRLTAANILIATGGWPTLPAIPGIQHVITSNEALELERLPKRMIIVGGGYIAVEFASIFNALGVKVTLLVRTEMLLRGFDADVRFTMATELAKKGITLRTETIVRSIEKEGDAYSVFTDEDELMETDLVMYATGRAPQTRDLGLEQVGVALNARGAIRVDEWSRTSVPNIYAIGDVTDRFNLTPVAIAEGRGLAETLFNKNPVPVDHHLVATAVFSMPPVGTVGLTESQARARLGAVDVYTANFRPMKHTLSGRDERIHMKLVVDRVSDQVVGCHMVGADAPEIIQGFAVALRCGATKKQFDATVGIHPSAAEEFVTMREKVPEAEIRRAR